MMYSNKLAAAIKVAGKVLREVDKDKVYLPFGSEYSIFLKNKADTRCVAHITIDGRDIGDGHGFVVPAKGSINVERFVSNGNLDHGNRLKFIERTGRVEDYRGVGIEDGLVEISFQFEREPVRYYPNRIFTNDRFTYHHNDPWLGSRSGTPLRGMGGTTTSNSTMEVKRERVYSSHAEGASVNASAEVYGSIMDVAPQNEAGVTAPGSISDQQFHDAGHISLEYRKYTMVFHLLGETEDNRSIREAVTVKHRPRCSSCGTLNAHNAKFCVECGTSLELV